METMTENADPNLLSIGSHGGQGQGHAPTKTSGGVGVGGFGSVVGVGGTTSKPPLSKKRVSISPKKSTILSPGGSRARNGRRRSSSHFGTVAAAAAGSNNDADEDDDDIEFTLDGAAGIGGGNGGENNMMMTTIDGAPTVAAATTAAAANKSKNKAQQRRRRRSSSRFLQLATGDFGEDGDANGADGDATRSPGSEDGDDFTSSEHLGEIYRQAIRMNAENKINAGNSWGFKLIENMDKFLAEDGGNSNNGNSSPRDDGREDLMAARQMKSRDDKGRVNFAKASCTLDASVKIYSYRVDDVHLSSFRVLANLNRSDNKKDDDVRTDENGGGVEEAAGEKVVKRRTGPRGPTETLETNLGRLVLNFFEVWLATMSSLNLCNNVQYVSNEQPISTCPSLTQPTISIHSFTRCPNPLMRVVPRAYCLAISASRRMDVTLSSIPRKIKRNNGQVVHDWTRSMRKEMRRTNSISTPTRLWYGTKRILISPIWRRSSSRCLLRTDIGPLAQSHSFLNSSLFVVIMPRLRRRGSWSMRRMLSGKGARR